MDTTGIGRRAEVAAADYLQQRGYQILDRNWRTRYCEIDVVARKQDVIYFVEVKYRANHQHGTGLDSITSAKQRQMAFAAELWVNNHRWTGGYELAALAMTGQDPFKARLVFM